MTSLRTLALEGADGVALAFQSAFQYFGFLSANRESAIEQEAERFRLAVLPDKSDEGWPAVELPLPLDATFQHATNAILSRTALWWTSEPPVTVLALISAYFAPGTATVEQNGRVSTVILQDPAATIRIGTGPRGTMIAVRQQRRLEDIRDVIRTRAAGR